MKIDTSRGLLTQFRLPFRHTFSLLFCFTLLTSTDFALAIEAPSHLSGSVNSSGSAGSGGILRADPVSGLVSGGMLVGGGMPGSDGLALALGVSYKQRGSKVTNFSLNSNDIALDNGYQVENIDGTIAGASQLEFATGWSFDVPLIYLQCEPLQFAITTGSSLTEKKVVSWEYCSYKVLLGGTSHTLYTEQQPDKVELNCPYDADEWKDCLPIAYNYARTRYPELYFGPTVFNENGIPILGAETEVPVELRADNGIVYAFANIPNDGDDYTLQHGYTHNQFIAKTRDGSRLVWNPSTSILTLPNGSSYHFELIINGQLLPFESGQRSVVSYSEWATVTWPGGSQTEEMMSLSRPIMNEKVSNVRDLRLPVRLSQRSHSEVTTFGWESIYYEREGMSYNVPRLTSVASSSDTLKRIDISYSDMINAEATTTGKDYDITISYPGFEGIKRSSKLAIKDGLLTKWTTSQVNENGQLGVIDFEYDGIYISKVTGLHAEGTSANSATEFTYRGQSGSEVKRRQDWLCNGCNNYGVSGTGTGEFYRSSAYRHINQVTQTIDNESYSSTYTVDYHTYDEAELENHDESFEDILLLTGYREVSVTNPKGDKTSIWSAEELRALPENGGFVIDLNSEETPWESNRGRILRSEQYEGSTKLLKRTDYTWDYSNTAKELYLSSSRYYDASIDDWENYYIKTNNYITLDSASRQTSGGAIEAIPALSWETSIRDVSLTTDTSIYLSRSKQYYQESAEDSEYLSRVLVQSSIYDAKDIYNEAKAIRSNYWYDTENRLIEQITGDLANGKESSVKHYEYYDGTQTIESSNQIVIGDLYEVTGELLNSQAQHQTTPKQRYIYQNGLITSYTQHYSNGSTVKPVIIKVERFTGAILSIADMGEGDSGLNRKAKYFNYDNYGRLIRTLNVDRNTNITSIHNKEYKDFGREVISWNDLSGEYTSAYVSGTPHFPTGNADLSSGHYDNWQRVVSDETGRIQERMGLGPRLANTSTDYMSDYTKLVNKYEYDSLGRIEATTISNSAGTTSLESSVSYDSLSRILRQDSPGDRWVSYAYPDLRTVEKTSKISGINRTYRYERDKLGRLETMYEPTDETGTRTATTYTYDGFGRMLQMQTTAGLSIATSNKTQPIEDPVTQSRIYEYDELGRVSKSYLPERGWISSKYGTYGVELITDSLNRSYSYTYKDWGGLDKVNLTLANGVKRRLVDNLYDDYHRLEISSYKNITLENCENQCRISKIVPARKVIEGYLYNAQDQIISYTIDINSDLGSIDYTSFMTHYDYDQTGRLERMRYAVPLPLTDDTTYGSGFRNEYDHSGYLSKSVQTTNFELYGDFRADNTVNYIYGHELGLLTQVTHDLLNGTSLNHEINYDTSSRLKSFYGKFSANGTNLGNHHSGVYHYFAGGGRIKQIGHPNNTAFQRNYQYDHLGRLNSVDYIDRIGDDYPTLYQETFGYDVFGNLLEKTLTKNDIDTETGANTSDQEYTNYTIDQQTNRLLATKRNDKTWENEYDNYGNLIESYAIENPLGDKSYLRDSMNHLSLVHDYDQDKQSIYTYNSQGLRVAQEIRSKEQEQPTIEYYHYLSPNLGSKLALTYQEATDGGLIAQTSLFYTSLGLGWSHDNETNTNRLLVSDHVGSPKFILDVETQEVTSQETLAYGQGLPETSYFSQDDLFSLEPNQSSLTTSNGFGGHIQDQETGLSYMQARYFNADIGRFLRTDPIEPINPLNPQSFNQYSYCNNDPINCMDPTGLTGDSTIESQSTYNLPGWAGVATIAIAWGIVNAELIASTAANGWSEIKDIAGNVKEGIGNAVRGIKNRVQQALYDRSSADMATTMGEGPDDIDTYSFGQATIYSGCPECERLGLTYKEYEAALALSSSIPGAGFAADVASIEYYWRNNDYEGVALSGIGFISGFGDVISLTAKTGKIIKLKKLQRTVSRAATASGRAANTALRKLARELGFVVEKGKKAKHLKARNPLTGEVAAQINHTPHTTKDAIKDMLEAAGIIEK